MSYLRVLSVQTSIWQFTMIAVLVVTGGITPANADKQIKLDTPPASLAQWYKPENKRQVWLHTMFRLRREMQAVSEYTEKDDWQKASEWTQRLAKDYQKIAQMVPEWKSDIKPRLLSELSMFIGRRDSYRTVRTLKMIQRTCDDCHTYYQPLVTAIYRSPQYDEIILDTIPRQTFEDSMESLSTSVNRIVIALQDGRKGAALKSRDRLAIQLQDLAVSCKQCHGEDSYPRERILGEQTRLRLEQLAVRIDENRIKDSQKLMGEIAVTVCARCHNTHRILADLRDTLMPSE